MKILNKATRKGVEKIKDIYEPSDLDGLTETELQEICGRLGLSESGTKAEMITRIVQAN